MAKSVFVMSFLCLMIFMSIIGISRAGWNKKGEYEVLGGRVEDSDGESVTQMAVNHSLYVKFHWSLEDLKGKGIEK